MLKRIAICFTLLGGLARAGEVPSLGITPGTDVAAWEKQRAVLLDTLLTEEYGRRPVERPDSLKFEKVYPDAKLRKPKYGMDAVRKMMFCRYRGPFGEDNFRFTAFIPSDVKGPVPAFVFICNRNPGVNIDPMRKQKSEFWPAEEIVNRGYVAIAFWNEQLASDHHTAFSTGVFRCFDDPSKPRAADAWGVLSAWAWGASRVMDWIETEPSIDKDHVAVVGHSRGGKTALLAGATDRRFAMAVSNCSGCSGAKMHRHVGPRVELIDRIYAACPFWFCPNFANWRGKDTEVPFDQHWLVAQMAPRLVYVNSAEGDPWAGPKGEKTSVDLAEPAWAVYDRNGCTAYHCRAGIHDLKLEDWNRFMDFTDAHGWRGKENAKQ